MKIQLKNRLHVLLRERGLRSASQFARRMSAEQGYALSPTHARRYLRDVAPPWDVRFVTAACNVLQCLPNDLYQIDVDRAEDEMTPHSVPPDSTRYGRREAPTDGTLHKMADGMDRRPAAEPATPTSRTSSSVGPSPLIFPFQKS